MAERSTRCSASVARVRAALRVRHRRRAAGAEELPAAAPACATPATASRSRPAAPCRSATSIARVIRVVDVKTPGSGEERRNRYDELALLRARGADQVRDLRSRRLRVEPRDRSHELSSTSAARCCSRRAPSRLPARELADWILADRLPVRFQIQLHKVLWGKSRANERMTTRAVVLLSGGLDSATCSRSRAQRGSSATRCRCRYGQRHHAELERPRASPRSSGRARASHHARRSRAASAARR